MLEQGLDDAIIILKLSVLGGDGFDFQFLSLEFFPQVFDLAFKSLEFRMPEVLQGLDLVSPVLPTVSQPIHQLHYQTTADAAQDDFQYFE